MLILILKMRKNKYPLIKEYRISKIIHALVCIDDNQFKRENQRDCILNNYPKSKSKDITHREKSIFRGMVITSLRYLGLIVGYGDSIILSANGKLLLSVYNTKIGMFDLVFGVIMYDLDNEIFSFIKYLKNYSSISSEEFLNEMYKKITASSEKQKRERINRWLQLLRKAKLIKEENGTIRINEVQYNKVEEIAKGTIKNKERFKNLLFSAYLDLSKGSPGIINIEKLRTEVALRGLKQYNEIITEVKFDKALRSILFSSNDYLISLGKPMGAHEKLFKYQNKYFQTIYIKFIKGRRNE